MTKAMNPKVIGITGGIGSGKSLIARVFATLGIPIYEADDRAKKLIKNDSLLKNQLLELLGPEAYLPSGEYNRAWVASQIFDKPELLKQVNERVHPRVRKDGEEWAVQHALAPYLLYEAAIMKAAGEGNSFQKVIVVEAPLELRIQRVKQRDNRTEQAIRDIMERQATEEERQRIADYTIWNDEKTSVIEQVLNIDKELRK